MSRAKTPTPDTPTRLPRRADPFLRLPTSTFAEDAQSGGGPQKRQEVAPAGLPVFMAKLEKILNMGNINLLATGSNTFNDSLRLLLAMPRRSRGVLSLEFGVLGFAW